MMKRTAITWQKVPSHGDAAAHWADADDHWTQVAHWEIQRSTWSTGPYLAGPLGRLTQSFPSLTENSRKLYFRRSDKQIVKRT